MLTGHRVVITGIGVLAPNGTGRDEFWRTLVAGDSGIGPVTLFDASDLPCRIGGEVKGFDPTRYMDAKLKPDRRMSRTSQLAVAAASLALADAGVTPPELRRAGETPIVLGVSSSAMDLFSRPPTLFTAPASVPHAAGQAISTALGIPARLSTISDGCASGADALGAAAAEIQKGKADLALAGASDSAITHYVFDGFAKSRMLSCRNDDPTHASRPFDRSRDGGLISEGAGVLVLENLASALARGARVYAEIVGHGVACDAPGEEPGAGMGAAMRRALANACRRPEDMDHVSAHAPSDEHMDRLEVRLIKEVFGAQAYRIPVVSIKGATGNPMAVGGVLQAIGAALALYHGLVPPTANLEDPDPECDLDHVPGSARPLALRAALVNSHGFGGGNSSVVLSRCAEVSGPAP